MGEEERAGWSLPEDLLRAFHFRAIQRIYGEQGPQVVSLLRQNPAVAVPTILARLAQKDAEWRGTKAEMMPAWQAIFKENFHKSLDHRSFYFKQAEKKNLTREWSGGCGGVPRRRRCGWREGAAGLSLLPGTDDLRERALPLY